jgi:hypothetical protein
MIAESLTPKPGIREQNRHECDIARSRIDFRFWGKNGRAADITGMTEFDPRADIGGAEIPQRSTLLPRRDVLSLLG